MWSAITGGGWCEFACFSTNGIKGEGRTYLSNHIHSLLCGCLAKQTLHSDVFEVVLDPTFGGGYFHLRLHAPDVSESAPFGVGGVCVGFGGSDEGGDFLGEATVGGEHGAFAADAVFEDLETGVLA